MREKIAEILIKGRKDYRYFAKNILFNPREPYIHDGQIKLLKKIENGKKRILVVSTGNRFGKTETIFYAHLRACIYKIGVPMKKLDYDTWLHTDYKTINLSFEYGRAKLVFDRFLNAIRRSPLLKEGAGLIRRISRRDFSIEFENNSVFYFGSLEEGGKHAEGESYRLLTIDEAHYEKDLEKAFYAFLLPRTIGVRGKIVLVGTPKEETPVFLENLWEKAKAKDPEIDYFEGSTYENVFLDPKDIKEMEKLYQDRPHLKAAALHGVFLSREGRWLTQAQITNMIDDSLPLTPHFHNEKGLEYEIGYKILPPAEGHTYVSFWDLGWAQDWTVGITLDVTMIPFVVVSFYRISKKNAPGMGIVWLKMKEEQEKYKARIYYDATSVVGNIVKSILLEKNIEATPFPFNEKNKEKLVNALKVAASDNQPVYDGDRLIAGEESWGRIRIPRIPVLIEELSSYTYPNDKKLQKDCVMALAGAIYIGEKLYKYNQSMASFREVREKETWYLRRRNVL